LATVKIHIIHVGDMTNKGTEALLRSDISAIKDIVGDVSVSVSTTDVEGVKRLGLPLDTILPVMVNIPYKTADRLAKKLGVSRTTLRYKAFAIAGLIYMSIQSILLLISATLTRFGLKAFYRTEVLKRIKNCAVVISCSDENFKEAASLLPSNIYWILTWWSMLFERTLEILMVRFLGKPTVMFPNSVGPFRTWVGRFLSRLSLNNCEYILIREPISYEIVRSLGIKSHKILTFDAALLYKPKKRTNFETLPCPTIGVCPGIYSHSLSIQEVNNYILEHAKALDAAIRNYGFNVLFLPHYVSGFEYDDFKMSDLILQKMKNKNRAKIVKVSSLEEFKSFLDHMSLIISSKMHPAVLGISGCVPTLCIAYDHKQIGLFDSLDMLNCTIHLRDVSCERLLSTIDFIWKEKEKITASLRIRIPEMQKNVRKAMKEALAPFIVK